VNLGLSLGHTRGSPDRNVELARQAETLGYECVWVSEAYGRDAATPLAWIGARTRRIGLGSAVMQMHSRTPALTAMTAATLDLFSGGRFRLGLGLSGPQVIEGWHAIPYQTPLRFTQEYVEVVRTVIERKHPLEYKGDHFRIPLLGAGSTGQGKTLKLGFRPLRPEIPIYLAALGPRNVRLAWEIADGWLPVFLSPLKFRSVYSLPQAAVRPAFDIAPTVEIVLGKDVQECRDRLKPLLALYIGGMGSREKNFYKDLVGMYGYEEEAIQIQNAHLEGRRGEAVTYVPDSLIDEIALCGPRERIAEQLDMWKQAGVTTLICSTDDSATLETMAELVM
jgi:F420-dependent oxidoreductase-like protein